MNRLIAVLIATGMLAACASSQPRYQMASNESDYGYYEQQIAGDRYRVNYNGKTSTSSDAVKDMALLRAAELTKLNDHDWFRVVSRESTGGERERSELSSGFTRSTRYTRSCGLLGCTTTASPGYSSIHVTSRPGRSAYSTSIEIVMGSGEVEDQTSVYDATELYTFLSNRY